ncbi:hypothetical protein [Usitatibacter palustris]|uniref:Uncharacterized protein n=1 Tax=Usitatibacter palustris TaxID=2732487 RepID=A0A6M4H5U0_9PROT|nr:hypothetical protein [Usitatibacter palustris]QJR14308.1 hypothetical protein DSM104440_01103 [Usitatibacter palustris]
MLYVAIFSVPFFAGLLPAMFFGARNVAIIGGITLGAVILGAMASGNAGDSGSILLIALVGIPLVALAFGLGVAIGNAIRIKTQGQPAKRLQAVGASVLVLAAGVGPIAYAAWQNASDSRQDKEAAMAFVAQQANVTALIGPVTAQVVTSSQENALAAPPTKGYTLLVTGERGEALVTVTFQGEKPARRITLDKVAAQRR